MKEDPMATERCTGWYALYLSITQNLSATQALDVLEGRKKAGRRLTWEQFLAAWRAGEEKLAEQGRRRSSSEKTREYQREYRRSHPLTEEQRQKRREYLRRYRDARRPGRARPRQACESGPEL
jgi:hypothetical protein